MTALQAVKISLDLKKYLVDHNQFDISQVRGHEVGSVVPITDKSGAFAVEAFLVCILHIGVLSVVGFPSLLLHSRHIYQMLVWHTARPTGRRLANS
jgi:hypothetical protein